MQKLLVCAAFALGALTSSASAETEMQKAITEAYLRLTPEQQHFADTAALEYYHRVFYTRADGSMLLHGAAEFPAVRDDVYVCALSAMKFIRSGEMHTTRIALSFANGCIQKVLDADPKTYGIEVHFKRH
jgi:hypothetical protein